MGCGRCRGKNVNDYWSEHFPDDALGKFCSRDSLLKILHGGKLLWSRPGRFNDPFDCQPHFRMAENSTGIKLLLKKEFDRFLSEEITSVSITNELGKLTCLLADGVKSGKISREEVQQIHDQEVDDLATRSSNFLLKYRKNVVQMLNDNKVLCLSKAFNEVLMWSHYAENHYGALIIFASVTQNSQFSIAKPVAYCEELPDLFDDQTHALLLTGQVSMTDHKMLNTAFDQITLTKASSWRYEKEWRISVGDGFDPNAETELNRFSLDDVVAIVFGARFPSNEIMEIVRGLGSKYPLAKWLRSNLSPTNFALDLEPIENS